MRDKRRTGAWNVDVRCKGAQTVPFNAAELLPEPSLNTRFRLEPVLSAVRSRAMASLEQGEASGLAIRALRSVIRHAALQQIPCRRVRLRRRL